MAKQFKLDLITYAATQDLPGGPTRIIVEEEIPDISIITDNNGRPTKGGVIGYMLAYGLLASFLVYFLFFL